MSDLRDAAALLTSLKAALDLTKAFLDVRGAVKEQGKIFELQRVILAAQEKCSRCPAGAIGPAVAHTRSGKAHC